MSTYKKYSSADNNLEVLYAKKKNGLLTLSKTVSITILFNSYIRIFLQCPVKSSFYSSPILASFAAWSLVRNKDLQVYRLGTCASKNIGCIQLPLSNMFYPRYYPKHYIAFLKSYSNPFCLRFVLISVQNAEFSPPLYAIKILS